MRKLPALATFSAIAIAGLLTGCGQAGAPPPAQTPAATAGATQTVVVTSAQPAGPAPTETAPAVDQPLTVVDPSSLQVSNNRIGWQSPSGNVWCNLSPEENSAGCQATDAPVPEGAETQCVNPTFTIDELTKGFILHPDSAQPLCFNQGVFSSELPNVLQYNETVSYAGYTCTSLESGMNCENSNGNGFVLSRDVARGY